MNWIGILEGDLVYSDELSIWIWNILCEISKLKIWSMTERTRWTCTRSSDLNPLDFYIWGHLKSIVYSFPIIAVAELQQRNDDACEMIRECLKEFRTQWWEEYSVAPRCKDNILKTICNTLQACTILLGTISET